MNNPTGNTGNPPTSDRNKKPSGQLEHKHCPSLLVFFGMTPLIYFATLFVNTIRHDTFEDDTTTKIMILFTAGLFAGGYKCGVVSSGMSLFRTHRDLEKPLLNEESSTQ